MDCSANKPAALNLDFVRQQFPAFSEPSLRDQAFFENAGGSYACAQVIERLCGYYRRLKLQPYGVYPASREAGRWMDEAYSRLAEYLSVDPSWLSFGPSTSQNTYVLAQAMRQRLQPGDEIIVTNQDHEANSGVWRRLAADGVIVREWQVDPHSGRLDPNALDALLNPRSRLLCFPHCSNIVADVNPVAAIVARAHAVGARCVVDGVSYAGHGLPDVAALGADAYLFSLYKTYGPHQGLMVIRPDFFAELGNQGHFFNAGEARKRLCPAGPDHAQVAAAAGVAEYFDALDRHHFPQADGAGRAQRVRDLLHAAESRLMLRLLSFIDNHPRLKLLGGNDYRYRAATLAMTIHGHAPRHMASQLAERGLLVGAGHFYAVRLLEAMRVDPAAGVLRISLLHYNSDADVERLIGALDLLLG